MIFAKRQDIITIPQGPFALGTTIRQTFDRTFPVESIFVVLTFTPTAIMATQNADGIQNMLKRIQLNVSDGLRTKNVVDASGPDLLEYAAQITGNLPRRTLNSLNVNSTAAVTLSYPIYCAHPQIVDPLGSLLLLPVTRYPSDPVLIIDLASQADMDTNAVKTFAVAGGVTVSLVINRRQVTATNWQYLDWDLTTIQTPVTSTFVDLRIDLPTPGSYTGTLIRHFAGTVAAPTRADLSDTNNPFQRIESLGVVYRRFRLSDIQDENDMSRVITATSNAATFSSATSVYLDYLTDRSGTDAAELGSVLDANIPAASGAKLQLIGSYSGTAAGAVRLVTHRIYGDLSALKLAK